MMAPYKSQPTTPEWVRQRITKDGRRFRLPHVPRQPERKHMPAPRMEYPTSPGSGDRMAPWCDAKQGNTGDSWHRTLIDPPFPRVVGDVRGLRVLGLGSGNGYLSRRFRREGAKVVAVDASAPIGRRARGRESH